MLRPPQKAYVDKSPIHGWGVFARERIYSGEVIEECPVLDLPIERGGTSSLLIDYRFNFPSGSGHDWDRQVIPLGYGCVYNHSNSPNANWYSTDHNTFIFFAIADIEPGQEICTYYGDNTYWEDGRSRIDIK